MRPFKKNVSVSLDEDIISYLNILAEMESRTFSAQINYVIKEYVKDNVERVAEYVQKPIQINGLPTKW